MRSSFQPQRWIKLTELLHYHFLCFHASKTISLTWPWGNFFKFFILEQKEELIRVWWSKVKVHCGLTELISAWFTTPRRLKVQVWTWTATSLAQGDSARFPVWIFPRGAPSHEAEFLNICERMESFYRAHRWLEVRLWNPFHLRYSTISWMCRYCKLETWGGF